jgi:hypothetical protein
MKSLTDVQAQFPDSVRARYDFSKARYFGALLRIEGVVCPDHGEFSQYASQFRKGRGCPSCGATQRGLTRRTPATEFFAKAAELHEGRYDYSQTCFVRMNHPVTIHCPEHGAFTLLASKHFYSRQGCGACEAEAKRARIVQYRHLSAAAKVNNTAKDFFVKCGVVHDGKYRYPDQPYHGAKEKIRIVCPDHGEFSQAAWAHLSGKGCAKCGAADPKWERDLVAFVESLGFTPQRSVPILAGRHVDVLVAEKQVGIELHGLRWHTESRRSRGYHREKWEVASKVGLRLIQVFEDEWLEKRPVVESRIAAVLGVGERFNARQCVVEVLEATSARGFLDTHHIQGAGTASAYYGLRFEGQLVAVASFGKARSGAMTGAQQLGVWEVIRYASVGRVRGGFTRLLKRFLTDFSPQEVVSYCDLRYGDGRVYAAAGFTLQSITEPDYWWVPPGKILRVPRYTTQKHKLAAHPVLGKFYAANRSEADICALAGWERIYGVGNQKWVLRIDTPESP